MKVEPLLRIGAWASVMATVVSCASAVESSKLEDGARRAIPVAICLKPLPRRGDKTIATLSSEDYWSLVFPSFDAAAGSIDRSAPDCAGRQLLVSPDLAEAEGPRTGPLPANPADVVLGQGPDGFKIVWLRTHKFADGSA